MRGIVLLLTAMLWHSLASAQVPHQINYQGYLTTPVGAPVSATMSMTFHIYATAEGGSDNTAVGAVALNGNTSGYSNTAVGFQALAMGRQAARLAELEPHRLPLDSGGGVGG